MTKDYYKILGVTEFETAENIKIAYRKLARKWHPDIAGTSPDVLSKFKEINEAYEILSNNIKKAEYDRAKRFYEYANKNFETKQSNQKTNSTNPSQNKKETKFSWEDILGKKNKTRSNEKQETKIPKKGENIYSDVEISVFEALNGTTKTINMLQTTVCLKCNGKKFVNGGLCPECGGKGEKSLYKKFTVKIPAGIKNGSKIRLAHEGGEGLNGGESGDLYITIHILEPQTYKTEGLNILKTVPITPFEAVLGTTLKINTINGTYNVKIAPNTQNGQKIRLTGCGIVQKEKFGDMIVTVEIRIPKSLTNDELELYKKLAEISSTNIREDY